MERCQRRGASEAQRAGDRCGNRGSRSRRVEIEDWGAFGAHLTLTAWASDRIRELLAVPPFAVVLTPHGHPEESAYL